MERLEHFISERFEEQIAAKLGHPKFDPHGHCIPAMDGKMPKQASIPLTDLDKQGTFTVDSISDQECVIEAAQDSRHHSRRSVTRLKRFRRGPCSAHEHDFENLHLSRDLAAAVRVRFAG